MSSDVKSFLVDDLCVLKITGEDAMRFLQGQLTNDVYALERSPIIALYALPNGRVLSAMRLMKSGQTVYALVNLDNAESLVKRLKIYVLRSKVTIEKDASLAVYCTTSPANCTDLRIQSDGVHPYFLYLDLPGKAESDNPRFWSLATQNHEAWIGSQTQGLFTPYGLNLDLKGGVSFTKGCYTGQEIIGRMHYHDKINRRAHRYATGFAVEAGSDVTDSTGRALARVIQSSTTEALVECEEKALQEKLFYNGKTLTLIQ